MKQPKKKQASAQMAISEEKFFEPFDAIHRDENAFIGFGSKRGESAVSLKHLFSLSRKQVHSMLPEIAQWLLEDAYMTVNSYYRTAPWNVRETGLPNVWRKEMNLRCLNAVYADLDIGRIGKSGAAGLSVTEAQALLIDLLVGGTLPPFSMTAQSGQGLYVLWLLRDDDDENAPVTYKNPKTFAEQKALYKLINRAIYKRLDCLAADRICDAARFLRVPGTRHSETGKPCLYRVSFDGDGKLVTYTLKDLAAWFGVPVMAKSLPGNLRQWQANENPISPQKANGPKSLAAARARDLVTLEQWRGGWKKGNRRFTLRLYAHFLKSAGTPKVETEAAVSIMASQCQTPYPSDTTDQPISAILRDVWLETFLTPTQQNLVKWLQVSADEARDLELEKIVPIEVQDERRIPRGGLRAQEKSQRHAVIRQIIEEAGMQSEREFVQKLEKRNIKASAATIHRDLIALGYQENDTRKKAGRPANQPALFDE
jgi:hypothetical protein